MLGCLFLCDNTVLSGFKSDDLEDQLFVTDISPRRISQAAVSAGLIAVLSFAGGLVATIGSIAGVREDAVDTALIVAVDVSQSVDQHRYQLQMEGIAQSLEDPDVLKVILNGPNGGILFAMVAWADKPKLVIDWQPITNEAQARHVAALVRALPHEGGEFTCMARMMDHVATLIVPDIPVMSLRTVLDVSGDGIDNCTVPESVDHHRDVLKAQGVTVNGLPILQKDGNNIVGSGAYRKPGFGLRNLARGPDTATTKLDEWFENHVITGGGAFLLAAKGYKDFGRAFRQKFVIEVSGRPFDTNRSVAGLRWLKRSVVQRDNARAAD